jgi:hypothetical protein
VLCTTTGVPRNAAMAMVGYTKIVDLPRYSIADETIDIGRGKLNELHTSMNLGLNATQS